MVFSLSQALNLLSSGGTQRYHTEAAELIKTQDVAQHSYNVFWLVHMLMRGNAPGELLAMSVMHDAGERWTGDVPAPTKRNLGVRRMFEDFEQNNLYERSGVQALRLTAFEEAVLKVADALEGLRFCHHETQLGNKLIIPVLANFHKYAAEALLSTHLREEAVFDRSLADAIVAYCTKELYVSQ